MYVFPDDESIKLIELFNLLDVLAQRLPVHLCHFNLMDMVAGTFPYSE